MKDRFILLAIIFLAASCKSLQPSGARPSGTGSSSQNGSVQFIDNIAINPESGKGKTKSDSYTSTARDYTSAEHSNSMDKYSDLQFKYSILENAPIEELTNTRLLEFMDEWYGTEYHYGGTSKDGIDCSAFVSLLMNKVYNIPSITRVSRDQYEQSPKIKKEDLQEGDLVFFHTQGNKKTVTHVGVYLRNNKFVHASISGVMISDMNQGYYAQRFVGAGRVSE